MSFTARTKPLEARAQFVADRHRALGGKVHLHDDEANARARLAAAIEFEREPQRSAAEGAGEGAGRGEIARTMRE